MRRVGQSQRADRKSFAWPSDGPCLRGGGSAVLTEIPEIFGAEQALLGRATDQAVFKKAVGVINGFKQYFIDHDQPVYENPSPGNKEGGITTLEEKSLGAVQKGDRILKPSPDTRIEEGDIVLIFALTHDVPEVERLLQVSIDFF